MVKRKGHVKPDVLSKARASKINPFEQLHSRKKFDVLGRKNKGQAKALRSRGDANEKVRGMMLLHYGQGFAMPCC